MAINKEIIASDLGKKEEKILNRSQFGQTFDRASPRDLYFYIKEGIDQVSKDMNKAKGETQQDYKDLPPSLRAEYSVRDLHRRRGQEFGVFNARLLSQDLVKGIPRAAQFTHYSIRTIHSVARSFGFRGLGNRDRIYLTKVFQLALDPSEKNLRDLKAFARAMKRREAGIELDLDKAIREASQDLLRRGKGQNLHKEDEDSFSRKALELGFDSFLLEVARFAYRLGSFEEERRGR